MPQLINTNIAALNVQRNLGNSQSAGMQAMERLASGLRINSANDDAAGLAISTRFTSQINGADVAVRNAGEGIALAQTAEGALSAINENLLRIRDLAVQSSNSTNSDVDRQALQAEVEQLVAEISLTSEQTTFNGRNLLDGSFSDVFQMGANAGQTVDLSIDKLTVDRLGASAQAGLSARGTDAALGTGDLVINGVPIGASRSADDSASTSNQAASAIAKSAAINRHSSETGVTAVPNTNMAAGSKMEGRNGSGLLTLNGIDVAFSTSTDTAATRAAVAKAINAVADLTGVSAQDTDSDAGGINLVAEDGRNIQLSFDTTELINLDENSFAAATGLVGGALASGGTEYSLTSAAGYTLISMSGQNEIDISGGIGIGTGDIANAGLETGSYLTGESHSVTSSPSNAIQPVTIGGGSISNQIVRSDLGGSLISEEAATATNSISSVATYIDVGWQGASFIATVGDIGFSYQGGAGDTISEVAASLDAAATAVGLGGDINFYDLIEFDVTGALTDPGGGQVTLAGKTLFLLDSNATGFSQEKQLVHLQEQINSTDFSAAVGGSGYLVAEMNEARDALHITIKHDTTSPLTMQVPAQVTLDTSLDILSGEADLNDDNYWLGGNLAYELINPDKGAVTVEQNIGRFRASSTTEKVYNHSATPLTTSEPMQVQISSSDVELFSGTLEVGSSVAEISQVINSVDEANSWEEISLDLARSNFQSGDTLVVGGIPVVIQADSSGLVSLDSILDSINQTDFSSANFELSASLAPGGSSAILSVRNFSGSTLTMESQDSEGRGLAFSDPDVFVGEQPQSLSGELKIVSADGDPLTVTLSDPSGSGDLFSGNSVTVEFEGVSGLNNGDVLLNEVMVPSALESKDTASAIFSSDGSPILSSNKNKSAIAVAASINQVANKTGVRAQVNPATVIGGPGYAEADLAEFEEGDQAGIYINGVDIGSVTLQSGLEGVLDTDRARQDAMRLINQASGKTGVTAVDNGVSLTLSAADGRNLSVAIDDRSGSSASIGSLMGLDAAVDGIGESTFGAASAGSPVSSEGLTYETTYGTLSLISASPFELRAGIQGSENLAKLGFSTGTFGGQGEGQFLQDLDISSFEGAQLAIVATDNAIEKIANQRAELGAVQNRLEASVSRLHIVSENLSSANSRILDADFAAETAEMSSTQVLQQAGMSVLAQANASSQQVLSLLG